MIVDGGLTEIEVAGNGSTKGGTIVDCSLGRPFLCRDGVVPPSVLRKYLPNLETDIDAYYEAMRKNYPSLPDLRFDHDKLEIVSE